MGWFTSDSYPNGVFVCINPACEFQCDGMETGKAGDHDASGRGHATKWQDEP